MNPLPYLVEANDVDVVEQLGEQLDGQGGVDAASSKQRHGRAEDGKHQTGGRVVIDVLRQKLIQSLRQLRVENGDEVLERRLNALGQHFLRLHAERGDVSVGLEKMEKLAAVGHPERQDLRIVVLLLDHVVYEIGDVMQEHRQFVGSLGRLQIGTVMSGSTVSGT